MKRYKGFVYVETGDKKMKTFINEPINWIKV